MSHAKTPRSKFFRLSRLERDYCQLVIPSLCSERGVAKTLVFTTQRFCVVPNVARCAGLRMTASGFPVRIGRTVFSSQFFASFA